MKNIKIYFFLLTLGLTINTSWACGEYQVKALVVMRDGISSLVLYPKTISEISLKLNFNESAKLSPYINRTITANIIVEQKMDATKGKIKSIFDIKAITPDPLAPDQGMGIKRLKESKCKSEK